MLVLIARKCWADQPEAICRILPPTGTVHCPRPLAPQGTIDPSALSAMLLSFPAQIPITLFNPVGAVARLSALLPHPITVPSAFSARSCDSPAAIATIMFPAPAP